MTALSTPLGSSPWGMLAQGKGVKRKWKMSSSDSGSTVGGVGMVTRSGLRGHGGQGPVMTDGDNRLHVTSQQAVGLERNVN